MDLEALASFIEELLAADGDEARQAVLSTRDLEASKTAIQQAGDDMLATGDRSRETREALGSMADAVELIDAEVARRAGAAAAEETEMAEIATRLHGETETVADDDSETLAAEETTDETAAETETAEEVVVETAAVEPPKAPRPSLDKLRAHQPADTTESSVEDATPIVKIKAALDIPGVTVGTDFSDLRTVAQALIARRQALGRSTGGSISEERVPVAHFDYIDQLFQVGDDKMMNGLLLMAAAAPEALTASGGFCAPAERIYDFVKINNPQDLTQDFLPTVGAPRGSIEFPTSPDIRDAFTLNPSRAYSNAEDIGGVHKVTTVIPCPSFNTCTVGAQYEILQFGNFGTRAYPEWVEHWIGLSADTHAHKVSRKLVIQMVGLSNAAVAVGPNGGATGTLISNLSLAAADFRHDLRMGRTATLEVVLPEWTHDLVRADLARARKGALGETLSVSDATIDGWIRNLGIAPHFVTDWQDISASATTGASTWPAGLNFLMYPPGTFIKLDMGTLDLGLVRDSTLNATNDYNLFVETFESVCKVGIESRLYSTSICATGAFSADQNLDCNGLDIPGS